MTPIDAASLFDLPDTPAAIKPLGGGLIHETYGVYCGVESGSSPPTHVLQLINTAVFQDAQALENNIEVVTGELLRRASERGDALERSVLRFVRTPQGRILATANDGRVWRMSHFVPDSITVDVVDDDRTAFRVAEAFGKFHLDLWDVPADFVRETIPDFHHTPLRLLALRRAVASSDPESERLQMARKAIALVEARAGNLDRIEAGLAAGTLSRRVCHYDAKISNVLLDRESRAPLCIIDLDTTSPGSPLLDVGDLLRSGAASVSEEERDTTQVAVIVEFTSAIIDGFLSVLGGRLSETERELLGFGGWLITMEQAIRYLTDFLLGDPYYGARYADHNLVRAENQLALARSMEESLDLAITTSE